MRIRTLLRILAAVVAAALVILAAVGVLRELDRARDVQGYSDTLDLLAEPSFDLVTELQAERRLTLAYRARGHVLAGQLNQQRTSTDTIAAYLRTLAGRLPDGETGSALRTALREVVRARAAYSEGDTDEVLDAYDRAIDRAIAVHLRLSPHDGELTQQARPLGALLQGGEALAREDAVLAATGVATSSEDADGRQMPAAEQARFAEAVGVQRYAFASQAAPLLPARERARYERLTASEDWAAKTRIENAVIAAPDAEGLPVDGADGAEGVEGVEGAGIALPDEVGRWRTTYDSIAPRLAELAENRARALVAAADTRARDLRMTALGLAGGAAVLILAVLGVTAVIGRGIARRAEEVRSSALAVARRQLPQLIVRLQRGEEVDLSVLPSQTIARDEFSEISNVVARLAEEVVEAARLVHEERSGFERFAEGVTLRAVTLVVAVLRMLDDLQHRYADTDPELLADLYELDHLTVRVRRQLENLLVLSGGAVANPHTEPVHIANLIVDAAGESRGFAQVSKEFQAEAWVRPEVAGELTHLIAELIENATTYSPSGYEVFVRATSTATGVAIEVEDKGRAPENWYFEALNGRLIDVPPYAVLAKSSDQLGLFVVGQLAQRHGVRVSLRQGTFGGVLAVVLVPETLLTDGPPADLDDARPARPARSSRPTGPRHRAPETQTTTAAGLVHRPLPAARRKEPGDPGAGPARPAEEPVPGAGAEPVPPPARPADRATARPAAAGTAAEAAAARRVLRHPDAGRPAFDMTQDAGDDGVRRNTAEPGTEAAAEEAVAAPPVAAGEPDRPEPADAAPDGEAAAEAPAPPPAARGGLPRRVPGTNLASQLRTDRRKAATAMDDRPLDSIESAFTQLQHALTEPEEDSEP